MNAANDQCKWITPQKAIRADAEAKARVYSQNKKCKTVKRKRIVVLHRWNNLHCCHHDELWERIFVNLWVVKHHRIKRWLLDCICLDRKEHLKVRLKDLLDDRRLDRREIIHIYIYVNNKHTVEESAHMHQPTVRVVAGPKKSGRVKGKEAIKEFCSKKERGRKRKKEKGKRERRRRNEEEKLERAAHTSYQMLT